MIVHIHGDVFGHRHGRSDQDPNGRFNAQDERGGRDRSQVRDEDIEYRIEEHGGSVPGTKGDSYPKEKH